MIWKGQKTLQEKEKMLLTAFSPFLTLLSKTYFLTSQDCMVKDCPFPNKPWFLRVCSTNLLKTLREKEKLLLMSNFSLSHRTVFSTGFENFLPTSTNLKFSSANHFSLVDSIKFVNWERVKTVINV